MSVEALSSIDSSKAEHGPLLVPGQGQTARRDLWREGENHSLNYEAGMHLPGLIGKTLRTDGPKAFQAVIERAGQTITAI